MLREMEEGEWEAGVAKRSSLKEFKELIYVLLKNKTWYSYLYDDMTTLQKRTLGIYDLLFRNYATNYKNVVKIEHIVNKYDWLKQEKLIDDDLFLQMLLTDQALNYENNLKFIVYCFNKSKTPLLQKCFYLADRTYPDLIEDFLKEVCKNLQEETPKALFLSKAIGKFLIKQEKTCPAEQMYNYVDMLNKYNFDFMQRIDGKTLIEKIALSQHPYLAQKILNFLPKNYQKLVAPNLIKIMEQYEKEQLEYNFFIREHKKEEFCPNFRIELEKLLLNSETKLTPRKINKL